MPKKQYKKKSNNLLILLILLVVSLLVFTFVIVTNISRPQELRQQASEIVPESTENWQTTCTSPALRQAVFGYYSTFQNPLIPYIGTRDVPVVNGTPNFDLVNVDDWSSYSDAASIASMPGDMDANVGSFDTFIHANGTLLRKIICDNSSSCYYKDLAIINGVPEPDKNKEWNAVNWAEIPTGFTGTYARDTTIYKKANIARQIFVMNNELLVRDIPLLNGSPDYTQAPDWKNYGTVTKDNILGFPTQIANQVSLNHKISTLNIYTIANDTKVRKVICDNNAGCFYQDVDLGENGLPLSNTSDPWIKITDFIQDKKITALSAYIYCPNTQLQDIIYSRFNGQGLPSFALGGRSYDDDASYFGSKGYTIAGDLKSGKTLWILKALIDDGFAIIVKPEELGAYTNGWKLVTNVTVNDMQKQLYMKDEAATNAYKIYPAFDTLNENTIVVKDTASKIKDYQSKGYYPIFRVE